jgi:hypothetical protein
MGVFEMDDSCHWHTISGEQWFADILNDMVELHEIESDNPIVGGNVRDMIWEYHATFGKPEPGVLEILPDALNEPVPDGEFEIS